MTSSPLPILKISFIGAGAMATAFIQGMIESNIISNNSTIAVSDICKPQLQKVETLMRQSLQKCNKKINIEITTNNKKCIKNANIIFLCIQPQHMSIVLTQISSHINTNQLIISIIGGKTISCISSFLSKKQKIIRLMPNTPVLIGEMAAGIVKDINTSENDLDLVCLLLSKLGLIVKLKNESLMDALTSVSGSGPAYIFLLIEAMSDGGVKVGLSRKTATKLAAQTVLGAAKMVLQSGKHCGELKDMVTSPAGATIQGINELEKNKFRYAIIATIDAVYNRCKILSKM